MHINLFCTALMIVFCSAQAWSATDKSGDDNAHFSGTLVALPCTIPESDQNIKVNMGTINARNLYFYQRTPSVPFTLHLEDCDTSIAKNVTATFTGAESTGIPGALAIDSTQSTASGIALGLEDENGKNLSLNQATSAQALFSGENILSFGAYVEGDPDAVKEQKIQLGQFTAIATLSLNYE